MRWFKHMSDMRNDVKIKRVIRKYGLKGYGLYNLILESIVNNIETNSPMPELEETAEDIADIYNENLPEIEEMVTYMIEQELLEKNIITGRLVCNKIYKFLAQSETRNKDLRKMITNYKQNVGAPDDKVYIMTDGENFKIGKSLNPKLRAKELTHDLGKEITLLAEVVSPYAYKLENEIHTLFKENRMKNEWFELKKEEYFYIVDKYGFTVTNVNDESEEQNRTEQTRIEQNREKRAYAETVYLTEKEYNRLSTHYHEKDVKKKILALDAYQENKKAYKNHYKTLLNWLAKDCKEKEHKECPICGVDLKDGRCPDGCSF